jgi:hypothetical protein
MTNGDRVLLKSQGSISNDNLSTTNIENGIYIYNIGDPSSLTRTTDCSIGDNVSNQLTFISDGSFNKMKAFIQDISLAIVGTNALRYVPFYSLNYNLGQGLELVGSSSLQVKSTLNFLSKLTINKTENENGFLIFKNEQLSNSETSKMFQSNKILFFDNDTNTNGYYGNSVTFACNNLGDDSKQTTPLGFNSSLFTIDVSGSNTSNTFVKYQACNNSIYGIPIGHNFTGNCYLNGYISFKNKTFATYEIPDTLGYLQKINDINRNTFSDSLLNLITTELLKNASYLMTGFIKLNYLTGKGSRATFPNVNLNLFNDNNILNTITNISLGDITLSNNFAYKYPFSLTISDIDKMYFTITTETTDVGFFAYIGLSDVVFVRMS